MSILYTGNTFIYTVLEAEVSSLVSVVIICKLRMSQWLMSVGAEASKIIPHKKCVLNLSEHVKTCPWALLIILYCTSLLS